MPLYLANKTLSLIVLPLLSNISTLTRLVKNGVEGNKVNSSQSGP